MAYSIDRIEGIGTGYADKLKAVGIKSTDQLLERCCAAAGRKAVAGDTGISETLILKWANMADLMRISGVGEEYSELLEAAGVDTVKELRTRNATNLVAAMSEANEKKKLTRRVPNQSQVGKWIEHAKTLEPKVTH